MQVNRDPLFENQNLSLYFKFFFTKNILELMLYY